MDKLKPCKTDILEQIRTYLNEPHEVTMDYALAVGLLWAAHDEIKNSRRSAPENKPLTLDQLRNMGGEPVWVVELKNSKQDSREQWQQFAYEEPEYNLMAFWEFGDEMENTYDIADYNKTWLAYARKPEVE